MALLTTDPKFLHDLRRTFDLERTKKLYSVPKEEEAFIKKMNEVIDKLYGREINVSERDTGN